MVSCLRAFLCGTTTIVVLMSAGFAGAAAAATPVLVAAYSFYSPSSVADASGNGNNGTTKNTSSVSAGKYGGALSFDGISSMVTVPDSASLHFTNGFTVEAWVDPASALGTAWQAVAVKERVGGVVFGLYANSNRSQPAAVAYTGTSEKTAYGTSQVAAGKWTHLAETFDGSAVRVFVNGTLVSTALAAGSLPSSTSPLRFGGDAVWSEFFHGLIDEARVYNRPLTASEISADMSTPIGTVAADTQAPTVPVSPHVTGQTTTSIAVAWTASSDNVGVTSYGAYRGGLSVGSSSVTSFTFAGLACGTSYPLGIDAADAAANRSARAALTAQTAACPPPADTQAPTAPANLTVISVGQTSVGLSWSAATDNVAVAGYRLSKAGAATGTTASTSATFSGLVCGTSYQFAVDAYDAAGNRSPQSTVQMSTSACPDRTPPSTPGGLVASSIGQTSVGLNWSASTDNTVVAGYGVYRAGTQIGSSLSTSTTVSGLVCATSYSLGVDAVDSAGNRSTPATVTVTTAACSGTGTGASFFVALGGSDAGSCTSVQPCATFNRAVSLASPGQVVEVAAGSYAAQSISAVKAGPAAVIVQPATGATVNVVSLDVSGSYVEVRSMTVTDGHGWSVEPSARFATLRNIHSPRGWVVGNNITVVGGEIGPVDSCTSGTEDGLQIWQRSSVASSHVTIDGVYIHDISDHDNSCSGYPNAGIHDDCVQILAGHYTTIRNSTFYNCPTSNVIARPYLDTLDHLTIENNVFNPERRGGASLSIGSSGDTCAGVVIQYNTLITASSIFDCSTSMIVRGNILPYARGGLCSYDQTPKYTYNVWLSGPACGATDRVCTPAFVNVAARDFHLALTDTCAKDHGDPLNYPATDFDGQSRPAGVAPDVGADETG